MAEVRLTVDCAAVLGESPVWDEATKTLVFIDIMAKRVFSYDPRALTAASALLPQLVGTVVPAAGGGLVAALEDSVVGPFSLEGAPAAAAGPDSVVVTPAPGSVGAVSGEVPLVARWAGAAPGFRFNDGKVIMIGLITFHGNNDAMPPWNYQSAQRA